MVDYYNLLAVPADAPPEAIRRAFRARAKAVHPDAHPHLPAPEREALQRRFILLAQACQTLTDPVRRADYDRRLRPALRPRPAAAHRRPASAQPGPPPGPPAGKPTGASGSEGSRAGAGEDPGAGAGTDESLEDLLREVESLLGRFGLELRPPFEALLEALLEWARAVYREVVEAVSPEAAEGDGGGMSPPRDHGQPGRRESPPPAEPAATRSPEGLEEGLEALRRRVGRTGAAGGPAAAADIEAELRRLKERLRRPP
jgi:curved DNA-binding protein CbpA